MAVILLLTTNDNETVEYPIMRKCVLGRSNSCDLTVDDKQMSGKHGMFELNENGHLIYSDLGSTNGSYLNNSQISKIQFKVDETLRLGNTIITIDEKRLNTRERVSIGRGIPEKEDRTMVIPAHKGTKSIVASSVPVTSEVAPEVPAKKTVVLNKDLKKKVPKSNWMGGKKDTIIEQDESSGKTKFLKLDINKHKKK